MGIIYSNAAMLLKAKKNNVSFDKTITLGHLNLRLNQRQLRQLNSTYGLNINPSEFTNDKYSDNFFKKALHVNNLYSLDYSDYQKCSIVHDLNKPIDSKYDEQFDAVIDGGTLEHVFNFPVALENCMRLVKKNGSIFIFTMANNHMGHGFYQFSPELFFRVFSESNGFKIREIVLDCHPYPGAELSETTEWYSITDPVFAKSRVGLVSSSPAIMMIHAVREEIKPIFETYPIQSDYVELHKSSNNPHEPNIDPLWKRLLKRTIRLLPLQTQNTIRGKSQLRVFSLSNRKFYKKWSPI